MYDSSPLTSRLLRSLRLVGQRHDPLLVLQLALQIAVDTAGGDGVLSCQKGQRCACLAACLVHACCSAPSQLSAVPCPPAIYAAVLPLLPVISAGMSTPARAMQFAYFFATLLALQPTQTHEPSSANLVQPLWELLLGMLQHATVNVSPLVSFPVTFAALLVRLPSPALLPPPHLAIKFSLLLRRLGLAAMAPFLFQEDDPEGQAAYLQFCCCSAMFRSES
jgi:hypothetical protein